MYMERMGVEAPLLITTPAIEDVNTFPCLGISPELMFTYLEKSKSNTIDFASIKKGFNSVARSALQNKATLFMKEKSNSQSTMLMSNQGIITNPKGAIAYTLSDSPISVAIENRVALHSVHCSGTSSDKGFLKVVCKQCSQKAIRDLLPRIISANKKRNISQTSFESYPNHTLDTPGMIDRKMEYQKKKINKCKVDIFRLRSKAKSVMDRNGIDLNVENLDAFTDDIETELSEVLNGGLNKIGISHDHIARIILKEVLKNIRVAKLQGKKQVRYHSIIIRLCITLYDKLKGPAYEFLRTIFNLPEKTTLQRYMSKEGKQGDGLLFETMDSMEYENKTKDVGDDEWFQYGPLSFDSMHMKDRVSKASHHIYFFTAIILSKSSISMCELLDYF